MQYIELTSVEEEPVLHAQNVFKRVLLKRERVPHIANFSQARIAPGRKVNEHVHTGMYEVFLVEAGEGVISIDAEAFAVRPGSCVVVDPGERHAVENTSNTELVITYFGVLE